MIITRYENAADSLFALFNDCAEGESLYRRLGRTQFENHFFAPQPGCEKVFLGAGESGKTVGIAAGAACPGKKTGYVTCVAVSPEKRRRGFGAALLSALEKELSRPGVERFEFSFYNPQSLSWILPGTPRREHPVMPGIDLAGPGYPFMEKAGYRAFAVQNAYYLELADRKIPPDAESVADAAEKTGYSIGFYDAGRHFGAEECMERIGSESWKKTVLENIATPGAPPLLIAEHRSPAYGAGRARMVGFTGPVYVQENGRGYLAGLAVDPGHRGHGLEKLLFCRLCDALASEGAEYMTLFTGEENPAKKIYESAGMTLARRFACMRKIIDNPERGI